MSAFRSGAGARPADRLPSAPPGRFTRFGATEQLIRAELRHDLTNLVNSIALGSTLDLAAHPHVRTSILNYGVPDIVWRTLEENNIDLIGEELRDAVKAFEPRIVPSSIQIERDIDGGSAEGGLRFVVRGDMICFPVDIPIEFLADIEIESRKIVIERL